MENNKQSLTIKSYISAIKAVLFDDGVIINQDQLLLSSLTRACRLKNDRVRTRLPIRHSMLKILVKSVPKLFQETPQPYLEALYKAMLVASYYGLLRVGEMTMSPYVIKAGNVHIGENKNKIMLMLHSSKTHGKNVLPQIIKIVEAEHTNKMDFCPFKLLY